ncbi:MAG: cation diffusion facilitator family transporter [Armatimonadota bacterium]
MMTNTQRKIAAARLSIVSSTLLIALKVTVGLLTHSVSILAEAIHSSADVLAATIAFFAVRVSEEPPDETHPYGHGKLESISGAVEAVMIFGAAAFVCYEAIGRLIYVRPVERIGWGIMLMLASIGVNWVVSARLLHVAKETESLALRADAANLRADIYAAVAVLIGLGLVRITGNPIFDPLVALGVSAAVIYMTVGLVRHAFDTLVDAGLPPHEIQRLEAVLHSDPRVLGFHKLRSRRAGSKRIIDLHIQVADSLSLSDAHRLTEEVESRLRKELPNSDVLVHTEPHDEEMRHQAEAH